MDVKSSASLRIRKAKRDDITAISDLATKTFVEAFGDLFSADELKERLERTRSVNFYNQVFDKDTILLAEEGDVLVGYTQYGDVTFKMEAITKEDQELQRVYVQSDYQGRGIGKALIEAAFADPRLKKARNVYLDVWGDNTRAQKLYKSIGFEDTGIRIDGDLIMIKKSNLK